MPCRRELTASQRTGYTKRRKVIPPELKATGYKSPPPQTQGFAASTAESTGMTKQAINRHIARADALGDDLQKLGQSTLRSEWRPSPRHRCPEPYPL